MSLATLTAGLVPALLRRPRGAWLDLHAYFLSWSYVGLVAAGVAQVTTQLTGWPAALSVGAPSAVVVLVGGILVHTRVPLVVVELRGLRE